MARDTAETRRRLIDAGARQFAASGFAGTRVDAIARDAGVNKERIYGHFGDKEGLFEAVLQARLGDALDGIEAGGDGSAAAGAFAGALADRYEADPALPRLLAWESLELAEPVSLADRCARCADAAGRLGAASGVRAGGAPALLAAVVTLVTGAFALPHLAALTAGRRTAAERRAALVAEATALARG